MSFDIDVDMSGLDQLQSNAEQLAGGQDVSLTDLFPEKFMRRYTTFPSFDQFVVESGLLPEDELTQDGFEAIPDKPWDEWVAENSDFEDWEEMIGTAGAEWASEKLTEGL